MRVLNASQSARLAQNFVPVPKSKTTKKVSEAAGFAKKLGFPVVLKLLSPKIVHKTEFGAVKVVHDEHELVENFGSFLEKARKKRVPVTGIMVQEFVKGTELILGVKKDETFGHCVLAGLGGVFVEVLKDVSFRVCPVKERDVLEMLDELKGKKLLERFRGKKPVNKKEIVKAVTGLCRLCKKNPEIKELDINPFIVNDKKGLAADVRVVLE